MPSRTGVDAEGSLPAVFTRFFGREAEIERLCDAVSHRLSAVGEDSKALTDGRWPGTHGVGGADGPRLVTLTGPGGIGKTRLALEVAARLRGPFQDAVWFVPLADLGDPRRFGEHLLQTLRLSPSPPLEPTEQVVSFFSRTGAPQPALLVLDNFEHLVEGGALIVRTLLERAPDLTVLVTSRRCLDLEGEQEFPVAPLPVPGTRDEEKGMRDERGTLKLDTGLGHPSSLIPHPSSLLACPSVRLFLDRAQSVRPDFQLTPGNAAAVAQLCTRLEGIPLALELAAARVWVLTPAQMLERLSQRFELLVGRKRDAGSRHRSLRAALDWSHQLLAEGSRGREIQRFFARLSVFRGGWSLEAAEAVCVDCASQMNTDRHGSPVDSEERPPAAPSPLIPEEPQRDAPPHRRPSVFNRDQNALELLEQLREASLILAEPAFDGQQVRYRMLETLREYAAEHLSAVERAAAGYRHAVYFLQVAERDQADPRSERERQRFARLESEHDNLVAALEWCVGSGARGSDGGQPVTQPYETGPGDEGRDAFESFLTPEPCSLTPLEVGFHLARALHRFWYTRGYLSEGRRWLTALLAHPEASALPAARARALTDAGYLAAMQIDHAAARPLLEESVARFRELDDRPGLALALNNLAPMRRDPAACAALYEESLALFRAIGDKDRIANALLNLGIMSVVQGDRGRARALATESRAGYEALGSQSGIALATMLLADLALEEGRQAEGRFLLEDALARYREVQFRPRMQECLEQLAEVARAEGDPDRARAYLFEALELSREMRNQSGSAQLLQVLAQLALDGGDAPAARPLLEEAVGLYQETGRAEEAAACREILQSL